MARQSTIAARRPAAHLPAVFAIAAPTAAPSSSPPRARAATGTWTDWRQALPVPGATCVLRNPDWSAEAAGRPVLGGPKKQPRRLYDSAPLGFPLSAPHARKGRVPGPPRRALGLRSPASLLSPPVGPTGAFPRHCLTARRAAPRKRAEPASFRSSTPASPTPQPCCPASGGGTPPTALSGLSPAILGRSTPAQLRKRRLVDAPRTP